MPIVARGVAKDSFSKCMKYKGIKNNVPFNNFFGTLLTLDILISYI